MLQQLARELRQGKPVTFVTNGRELVNWGYDEIASFRIFPLPFDFRELDARTYLVGKMLLCNERNQYFIGRCIAESTEGTHFAVVDIASLDTHHVARRDIKGFVTSIQFRVDGEYDN